MAENLYEYSLRGVDGAHGQGRTITVIMNDEGTHVSVHGVPYLEERTTQAQNPQDGSFGKYNVESSPVLRRGETLTISRDESDRVVISKT